MEQTNRCLTSADVKLVEYGVARFSASPDEVFINEPIVLLAATRYFSSTVSGSTFKNETMSRIRDEDTRGLTFERLIALYLISAFDDKKDGMSIRLRLSDLFNFGTAPPEWAKQSAHIVYFKMGNKKLAATDFCLSERAVPDLCYGRRCRTIEDTVEWFENPETLMCFPDKLMGPDIVFFLKLDSGSIICVGVQCKWRSAVNLTTNEVKKATGSLEPLKFFVNKVWVDFSELLVR